MLFTMHILAISSKVKERWRTNFDCAVSNYFLMLLLLLLLLQLLLILLSQLLLLLILLLLQLLAITIITVYKETQLSFFADALQFVTPFLLSLAKFITQICYYLVRTAPYTWSNWLLNTRHTLKTNENLNQVIFMNISMSSLALLVTFQYILSHFEINSWNN